MLDSTLRMFVAVVACISLLAAGPTLAQSEEADEETPSEEGRISESITVTARQVEENVRDVPATVSVLSGSQLERVGVRRAEDFVRLVPGVTMVNAAEVADTQVNIRGINGSRDAENSFAFIVDGILMTNPAAFNREFVNLKQIEVLKGPQGALYGRNASAGAIIVTTRKPGFESEGQVTLTAGEDESYYASATYGGQAGSSGNTRYLLHGNWRTTNGFYENSFQGRDDIVDDFQSFNLEGRLVFGTSDSTSWDLKAHYGEVDAASITFNAAFALPGFALAFGDPKFFENVNDHNFVFQPNIDPQNDQESIGLSARTDHVFDWGNLTAWLLYSDIENSFFADGTSGAFGFFNAEPTCISTTAAAFNAGVVFPPPTFLGPIPAFSFYGPYTPTSCDGTQFQVRNQEDISFEIRLTGDSGDRLRWQGGIYYLNIDREVGVNLGIDQGQGVVEQLFVPQGGANPTEQLVHDRFETDVFAAFGALRYDIKDNVEASLAVRWDQEKRDVTNLVPTDPRTQYVDYTLDGLFLGNAPLNPGLDPGINPSGMILPKSETFDEVQPKVSLAWGVGDSTTLYGSWGVGFKSGGFNNQGSNATVQIFFNDLIGTDLLILDQFNEETSSAFEAGFKSNVTNRFYVEGAYYNVEVDDMQFFEFLVGPFGLLRVVSNIDEVEIEGIEIGLDWWATNSLRVYAGYNYIDSEIIKNSSRPATVGNTSPYTPDYTGDLAVEFSQPVSDRWNFTASGYYSVVGKTWFHTVQDQTNTTTFNAFFPGLGIADYSRTERATYELVDIRIGVAQEHWSVTLVGTNVTDEEYLEENITAPEFGGSFSHPGTRSRWGVEFGYRF